MDLSALILKSRQILKAIKGEADDSTPPPVPQPPADESRLDPRAEGGEPTDKKVEDASADKGEGAGEDPDALTDGGGSPEGDGAADAGADGGSEGSEGSEGGAPEDYEDLDPEKVREAKKALGLGAPVGHPGPDDLGPNGLPPEQDGDDLLTEIMNMLRDQNLVLRSLQEELNHLKSGAGSGAKELKKALEEVQDLRKQIANIHATAPADAPRAIQKALDTPAPVVGIARAEVMELARTGSLSPVEIALLNTQARD